MSAAAVESSIRVAPEPAADVGAPVVRVLGIRHHGPGSARSVVSALEALQPDAVLIEGPADADAVLEYAAQGMEPPVALFAYAADDPSLASFWPFATFSPEWQALSWALSHRVKVGFCDLPAAQLLARVERVAERTDHPPGEEQAGGDEPGEDQPAEEPGGQPGEGQPGGGDPEEDRVVQLLDAVRDDPIAQLAIAAGYDDPERWWEDVIEHRIGEADAFDAITEAMAELRISRDADRGSPRQHDGAERRLEARREAQMRTVLRATLKGGARRVAVVCGAWHAPALTAPLPSASADAAVLRGARRRKVVCTWVPWTHGRLAFASGYGAGIDSPGWYHHLFTVPDRPVARWLTRVAGVLRADDLPVSSAHVIEAVRLAETLATLRGRPLPGLSELTDATRSVLCAGNEATLALVTRELVVGDAIGTIPPGTPSVPLDADLRALARRLRLKLEPAERVLDLDLRTELGRERSRLLHRLRLLDIGWGVPAVSEVRNLGTFRETWRLRWRPDFAVSVVLAAMWGATVMDAAAARLSDRAERGSLPESTAAVESCLLADLPTALPELLAAVDASAAAGGDIGQLMTALPPLARSLRYGDVRGTDRSALARVADTVLVRIRAALPAAVVGLDDDAAAELRSGLDAVHAATGLLDETARSGWLGSLDALAGRDDLNGLLTGRMTRVLHDAGRLEPSAVGVRLARALSTGTTPTEKAGWVDGFFAGGGLLLVHDPELLALLDGWVDELDDEDFLDALPLLRRTFGAFEAGERHTLGDLVRRRTAGAVASAIRPDRPEWDVDRARGLPVARAIAAILNGAR